MLARSCWPTPKPNRRTDWPRRGHSGGDIAGDTLRISSSSWRGHRPVARITVSREKRSRDAAVLAHVGRSATAVSQSKTHRPATWTKILPAGIGQSA